MTMRSGLLLFLLLPLFSFDSVTEAPGATSEGEKGKECAEGMILNDKGECEKDDKEKKDPPTKTCAPPIMVVLLFTIYGGFLIFLCVYGGKQWIGLMEAKVKLRKLMALEVALIHYDEYCERKGLHGRRELFIPASNDGFFLDPLVQEAWLSVNNLRKQVTQVPTSVYSNIMRSNWDIVKREKKKFLKTKKNIKEREQKNRGSDGIPALHLDMIIEGLRSASLFTPNEAKMPEEAGSKEGGEGEEKKEGEGEKPSASATVQVEIKDEKKDEKKEEKKEEKGSQEKGSQERG